MQSRRPHAIGAALLALSIVVSAGARAQFPEDALRFATPGSGVGARALGMGGAFTGVANDFSALYWNPAGLAQVKNGEFSLGMSHLNYRNTGSYFGLPLAYSNSSTTLNALGFVLPTQVQRGALVFAFGYARENNFTTGLGFDGFNPLSSIIQDYAPDGALAPSDPRGNLMWELYLADVDTVTGRWISPIRDSLTQAGTTLEGGGLDNWSVAGAVDIAPGLSAGLTLTYASGSYSYERTFRETDTRRIHTIPPYDLDELTVEDFIDSDISAFRAKAGLFYRSQDLFRVGLTIRPPAILAVRESFSTRGTVVYDNGDVLPVEGPYATEGTGQYDVLTPWTFGAGGSVVLDAVLLSADLEYTDWSQLEFRNADASLIALNREIKTLFRGTLNARAGVEVNLPAPGLRLRGGFMYFPSRYDGDPSEFDQKYITGGLGFLLGSTTMLDIGYAGGWWKTFRANYGGPSRVDEDITTHTVTATLSYRF